MMKKMLSLIFLLFALAGYLPAGVPAGWNVNPANFEHVMTVTAILNVDGQIDNHDGNVIAAFAGSECRGTASPLPTGGKQMYFMMVYGNTPDETISFKTYYQPLDSVLINSNFLTFSGNASYGEPDNPFEFQAASSIVGIREDPVFLNRSFSLNQNFPNPFNPETTIEYSVRKSSHVIISVCNVKGQIIASLVNGYHLPGDYAVQWNACHENAGAYFYRISADGCRQVKKMILLK